MRLRVKLLLSVSLLAVGMGPVQAGNEGEQTNAGPSQFKKKEENDILNHLERGETVKKTFKPIQLKASKTLHYDLKVKQKTNPVKSCQADIVLGYLQFETRARIDTTISNADCAASSGQYRVILQITDKNGKAKSIQHVESWSRSDAKQVVARKFFDIGSNAELMRATIRGLTCTCTQDTAKVPDK